MSGFDERPSGFHFVTLTAPGVDGGMHWDKSICGHSEDEQCSGKRGCQTDGYSAAVWNGMAPQAWSWFVTEVRRELGESVDVQFFGTWETQSRGLLHRHALMCAPGVSAKTFDRAVRAAAGRRYEIADGSVFAWGPQVDCQKVGAAAVTELMGLMGADVDGEAISEAVQASKLKAARYLAKYCTKGGERAVSVNLRTGEIRRDGHGYRTWSASSRWGLRMHQVRHAQRSWRATADALGSAGRWPRHEAPTSNEGTSALLDLNDEIYASGGSAVGVDPSETIAM